AFETTGSQSLATSATGTLGRWEFWDLAAAAATRDLSVSYAVNGMPKAGATVTQVAGGTYGYLTIESALGYSDGQHAALFSTGSTLDTAVQISAGADTTVTLPAGTYTLDIWNDAAAEKSGVTVNITAGQTASLTRILNGGGTPVAGWNFSPMPANLYPGNQLAIYLDAEGLTAGTAYSNQAYVYVTGSGAQVSQRYNRSTGTFADGLTAQTLTADDNGAIRRWEFWTIGQTSDSRGLSARVKVDGTKKVTANFTQVGQGSFGYLSVEKSLPYSDGLHAALFTKDGQLDTAARVLKGADTKVTLPAGAYTLAIWDDNGPVLDAVEVTIEAGKTVSLQTLLDKTPPVTTAAAPQGWQRSPVTVAFTATDDLSGVAATYYSLDGAAAQTGAAAVISTEGDHLLSFWSVDNAGNVESAQSVRVQVDLTAPVIGHSQAPAANQDGWNNTDVAVTFICSDALSGLATCSQPVTVAAEGKDQSVMGTATDIAGNTATDTVRVSIDRTAPVIVLAGAGTYAVDETVT
ncbi:MAG TPA: hypothetical protein VK464_09520, partial [Symbiobacteriaceae bacterium]|nr:hypothetical protein [Symbiobacteriaceae bacterium]